MQLTLHAVTLLVDDYDDAIAHYVGVLGFTLLEDTLLEGGRRWVRVSPDREGRTSLLLAVASTESQQRAVGRQTGGRVGFFLHTTDFDGYHDRLIAAGIDVTEEPRPEPYGTVVVFRDRRQPVGPDPAVRRLALIAVGRSTVIRSVHQASSSPAGVSSRSLVRVRTCSPTARGRAEIRGLHRRAV
jgi:catechol 2,3-dioxygenase-like lactoylglutathione lyase family enzyme